MKFTDVDQFKADFNRFWSRVEDGQFAPRQYILENLTLEQCARKYLDIAKAVESER